MKVIVFGGSGFIGSHVADELTEKGYDVDIFDRIPSKYLKENQKMIIGDIFESDTVEKAIKNADYVYNFAGIADLDDASTRPLDTVRYNILGNNIILDASVKARIKRYIYASTIYVYSSSGGFYRCSKQAAELYIEEYSRKYNLDYTILRFGTVYGPRADERNSIYRYLLQALKEGRITCQGTGEEMREYIHVRDVARACVEILSDEFRNNHIILTGNNPMKFKEMLEMIKEILNNEVEIEFQPVTKGSNHYNITPYSFTPKIGDKYFSKRHIDMGQGILESIHEIYGKMEKVKQTRGK